MMQYYMRRLFLILVTAVCWVDCISAGIVISGSVSDSSGVPLEAIVTLFDGKDICGFTTADESGRYTLSVDASSDTLTVRASLLGYDSFSKVVPARSATVDFVLDASGMMLKEVSVVADKIIQRGDTISFQVGAFKSDNDRVIGDVIRKMPGLEVADNGKISFNGKVVKNFYVEDMDLLQGRYGIATNNVSANDVASVQVYQNHQPIKALQDWISSENVTINLRLKSTAKGTWSLGGMVGGGYKPALWTAEATAMYFGRTMQTISTYKGNNCGVDISSELKSLTGDAPVSFYSQPPLHVMMPSSP